jgi:hypothetical protein
LILSKFGTLLMAFSNSSFNFGISSLVMARASATPTFVEPIFVAVPDNHVTACGKALGVGDLKGHGFPAGP